MRGSSKTAAALSLVLCAGLSFALEADEQLAFADGLYVRQLYDLAIPEYVGFLKTVGGTKDPREGTAHYRLGECYSRAGKKAEAETSLEKAFSNYPESPYHFRAGLKLAELRHEAGKHATAISTVRELLSQSPPDDIAAAATYLLGESLLKSGDTEGAALAFRQIEQKYASSSFLSSALLELAGICAAKPSLAAESARLYRRVADAKGSDRMAAEALFQLGEMHFRSKAFQESAAAYAELFQRYPQDLRVKEARLQAAWALHNAARYAEALQCSTAALGEAGAASDSQAADWLYLAANCQRQLGSLDASVLLYERLLRDHPGSRFTEVARYETALTYYKVKKYADVLRLMKSAKPDEKLKQDVYWLLAESYAALDDNDSAFKYYGMIADGFPGASLAGEANYRMAFLLQKKGDLLQASRRYLEMVAAAPKHELAPRALFASGVCLFKETKYAEAVRDWSRLAHDYPDSPMLEDALYQKALAEINLGRDNDGRESLRLLLTRFPKTRDAADAHYWLGMLLHKAGSTREAEQELRQGLASSPRAEAKDEMELQLAVVLHKLEKYDEAAERLEGVIGGRVRGRIPGALLEWLSEKRRGANQLDKAMVAAEALSEIADPAEWGQAGWCIRGRICLAKGGKDAAAEAFERALALRPRGRYAAESALRLGQLALEENRSDVAVKRFTEASSLASSDSMVEIRAHGYVGLAKALKAQGKLEDAARHFLGVGLLFEDADLVPECLYEAAVIYGKLGNGAARDKALKELKDKYPQSPWASKPLARALRTPGTGHEVCGLACAGWDGDHRKVQGRA